MFCEGITLLAQADPPGGDAADIIGGIVGLAIIILLIAAMMKTFSKAGQPSWGAMIPIYNLYLMCKMAGKPGWWTLLMLIPFVNLVMICVVCIGIARNFGKDSGFGLGLAFFGFIFYPILAFGNARYHPKPPQQADWA